jgi:hypothetical protein
VASQVFLWFVLALLAIPGIAAAQDVDGDGVLDASDNCPTTWNRTQDDHDGDSIGDVCDDCRFESNALQTDAGAFGTGVPDGIGDACQCGDVRANGTTNVVDVAVLRRYLLGLATGGIDPLKCPVSRPGGPCDASAVLELRDALTRVPRALSQVCAAAICDATACGPGGALCAPNAISSENLEPGVPPAEWDIAGGSDDANLLGFTTNYSYAPGETVQFKIHAALLPASYSLTIYRVGWYGGNGARRVATLVQNAPVSQPACQSTVDPADCSNWSVTDVWPIPPGQVSGIYLAKLLPNPVGASNGSQILFVIRDDTGGSDILFQTDDPTWMAYNPYPTADIFGGTPTSLYNGAARVSYDRPHRRAVAEYIRSFWGAQLHLVRFLERNGYDVSYFAGVDAARRGSEIAEHRVWISSGHDEYWSREMRDAVDAARDAGTNLIFLSGNLMYWKTRWENGFRTEVGYKTAMHSHADDPDALTSTWRDVRFEKPTDLAEPENSTTGLIFGTNGSSEAPLEVPAADGELRLWRGTAAQSAGACDVTEMAPNTVGFEWDHDQDNGHRPAGLFRLSSTNIPHAAVLYGAGTGAAGGAFPPNGQATHHVSMYRAPSGALVFASGSVQWSHGLGRTHLPGAIGGQDDVTLMQATANLLADMGVQAATPRDFCSAAKSVDTTAPDTSIDTPANGASLRVGSTIEIVGTATDVGGHVAGVEVSLDSGASWQRAEGRESWHYTWRPGAAASYTIESRAVDDSGNLESTPDSATVDVGCAGLCSVWPPSATPAVPNVADSPVEVGVRFRADVDGTVRSIRFWSDALGAGTHAAHLWSAGGTLLASATESPGSPFSGWHEAVFASPVPITANATYTASYHTSAGYAYTLHGLDTAWYRQPLAALASGGVYTYGASPSLPTAVYQNANYFVDVDFTPTGAGARRIFHAEPTPAVPDHLDPGAQADAWGVEVGVQFRSSVDGIVSAIDFYRADDATPQIVNLWRDIGAANPVTPNEDVPGGAKGLILESGQISAGTGVGWQRVPLARPVPILAGATYVASYHTRERYAYTSGYFAAPVSDPPLVAERSLYRYGKTAFPELSSAANLNYWVDVEFTPGAPGESRMWTEATVPSRPFVADAAVELGVRFTSEVDGFIDGIRYYRHPSNGGAHTASLWSDAGAELATASFVGESGCGWQEAWFSAPVAITAGTIYVASYHTTAGYAVQKNYFGSWSPPLRAVEASEGSGLGNGVYHYGAHAFPAQTSAASNYFVDVMFRSRATPIASGPTSVPAYLLP